MLLSIVRKGKILQHLRRSAILNMMSGSAQWLATAPPVEQQLEYRLNAHLRIASSKVMLTDNAHTMVSVKRRQGHMVFRLHHMFTGAPPQVLRALAQYAETHCKHSMRLLQTYIAEHEQKIRERPRLRKLRLRAKGQHHDLQAMFAQLNHEYLNNAIQADITWGQNRKSPRGARRSIRLGSYAPLEQLIRIHPVLDSVFVPEFFVASVVYHEMLHEVHGVPLRKSPGKTRREIHSPAFRKDEAKFAHHAEAMQWQRENLTWLLRA